MALKRADCKPSEAWMVAAHEWDILGADAVGMRTVWITRLEKRWLFAGEPPGRIAPDLAQASNIIAKFQARRLEHR